MLGVRNTERGNHMDILTAVELIEDSEGTVCHEMLIEAWQYLVDTGVVWTLQGSYGRRAEELIKSGYVMPRET